MSKTIYNDAYRDLIVSLRKAREDLGVTQAELAKRMKKSQQWLSVIERGSRRADIVEFVEICSALAIDPQVFVASLEKRIRLARGK